ncbi:MAG: SPOR domain-containing protein, partial [Armatimonadetes bacterium]|nr:SPOR domain-containing protein [Armatimonadota bacterium]
DDSQPAENPPATESDNASSSQAPAPAWQVTAGSYRDERNAQQVVQSLQAQGLSAHVEEVQVRGQTFNRVIAGAYSSRDEAKTTADKVQAAGYPSQVLKKR